MDKSENTLSQRISVIRKNLSKLDQIEFGQKMSEEEIINTMKELKKLKEMIKLANSLINDNINTY
jgi:hypothetical protein